MHIYLISRVLQWSISTFDREPISKCFLRLPSRLDLSIYFFTFFWCFTLFLFSLLESETIPCMKRNLVCLYNMIICNHLSISLDDGSFARRNFSDRNLPYSLFQPVYDGCQNFSCDRIFGQSSIAQHRKKLTCLTNLWMKRMLIKFSFHLNGSSVH